MSGPPDPWGPPPWQPQPWAPPPWQPPPGRPPPWQPQPWRPLPPVVPARYDGPAPGADGGPPDRRTWVVVSVLAALVLVAGAVVALLLAGSGSRTEAAGPAPAPSAAEPLLFGAGKRPVRLDSIPASPRLEPALGWDRSVIDGPDGAAATTALRFVQAVRAHDWPTAYGLCAAAVREAATTRARQLATTPPTVVGAAFYGDELRGQAIADGALLAVESSPSEYLVTFRLQLADASTATVTLWVSRQQAVQDWT